MTQKIVFSIIIPVYNTSRYLPDCLDSILQQDFHSYEIICVDNNSTDNSLQILNNYSKEHSCIRILTENSQGVGKARNRALQTAKGHYICFVDSDDYIYQNLLSECYEQIVNQPDIIIFGAKTLKSNHIKNGQYSSRNFPKTFSVKKLFTFHTISYNKIYKSSFLKHNNIQFGTTRTGEDQIFTIKSLLLARNIKILKKDLYIYRRNRKGSLTNDRTKKDLSPVITTYEIENFLTENNTEHKLSENILSRYVLKAISWYGKTEKIFTDTYFNELAQMLDYIKKRNGRYWWDYFNLSRNCSYLNLKINYIKALILYFLHEKIIIIPAGLLFFLDLLIEFFHKTKSKSSSPSPACPALAGQPAYLLQTILNRLFGRVLSNTPLGRLACVSGSCYATHSRHVPYRESSSDNKTKYYENGNGFSPKIRSKYETLQILINSDYSICRFGDGEFKLIFGQDIGFQRYTKELAECLQKILVSSETNILIGIPDKFGVLKAFNDQTSKFWRKFLSKNRDKIYKLIDFEKQYFCAEVSRPYMEEKNKSDSEKFFNDLKKIWQNKKIILVEGKYSRLGYNNDLFDNAISIKRIICPERDAFNMYDKILEICELYEKDNLFILALGPTATVLAYDLAKDGYRALDLGHIDIEYEWFLRKTIKKIPIKNKYVNETKRGRIKDDLQDKNFEKEILVDLTQ